jgi:hypothetical protein
VTSVLSGAGLSLNTSTGAITGDPVNTATTYNFTLRATSSSGTADRAFTYTVEAPQYNAQYLLVAGGGAGGTSSVNYYEAGGGGGAGGVLSGTLAITLGTTYSFVIGQGGTGSTDPVNNSVTDGTDTTGLGLTAVGGGKGTNRYNSGTSGQGNAGGGRYSNAEHTTAGGGGGAGSAGQNGQSNSGGAGGNGVSNSITGSAVTYGGGGGGAGSNSGHGGGSGGSGGGGNGHWNSTAGNGTDGLGGGGGGSHRTARSGDGGNGVLIIRVPTSDYTGTYTGSPTVTTVGTDTVLKFLANGSYTA